MANYSYKYPLLNDEMWLRQKYEIEKLSTNDIIKLVGAKTSNSVCQALRRYNIPIMDKKEGYIRKRESDGFIINEDVIIGSLLGDGMLAKYNKYSNLSYPSFKKRNKFKEHIEYVASQLGLCYDKIKYEQVIMKNSQNKCDVYTIKSLSYESLLPMYKEWYPEHMNFRKSVPENIKITPTVLLHWFLDDGCVWNRKDRNGAPIVGVLCSESFTKDENQLLIEKIHAATGLKLTHNKTNSGTGSRISIPTSQINQFYDIIGECPINCLSYKWKSKNET